MKISAMKSITSVILLMIILFVVHKHYHHDVVKPLDQANKIAVSTLKITHQNGRASLQALGNVKASKSIAVSSEIAGMVTAVSVESGQVVNQGQLLLNLRSTSVEAGLQKAEATYRNDFKNYQRRKSLLSKHYISAADVDNAFALVEKDKADVDQQAALLSQHHITAPFSGVVGIRQVELGQYLAAGQAIVNLELMDPVYVDFSIPEKWVSQIKIGERVDVTSDAFPDEQFQGSILATSNAIDMNNRSLQVRVTLANPQKKLLSGMAVTVSVSQSAQKQLVVPQSALTYTPDGVGVYVIDNQLIAHWRAITVGERQRDDVIVVSGLTEGDTIIIAGQQKLQEGSQVLIHNENTLVG